MVLVKMRIKITGYRNGEEWPDPGYLIEVPDHEAADLVACNYGEFIDDDAAVAAGLETPEGDLVERVGEVVTTRRRRGRPRKDANASNGDAAGTADDSTIAAADADETGSGTADGAV